MISWNFSSFFLGGEEDAKWEWRGRGETILFKFDKLQSKRTQFVNS